MSVPRHNWFRTGPDLSYSLMRFYEEQHEFYVGIDLHARQIYVCVTNAQGETLLHRNMPAHG